VGFSSGLPLRKPLADLAMSSFEKRLSFQKAHCVPPQQPITQAKSGTNVIKLRKLHIPLFFLIILGNKGQL
jgi:hypothetical protein